MITVQEIIESGKTHIEYCQNTKEWLLGRPDGKMLAFPAGDEGKRAAQLSALTHDCPDVAAWVEVLTRKYPQDVALYNRLLRAGYILRDTPPMLFHRAHYAIQSQHNPQTRYMVWWLRGETKCGCEDWFNGNAHHIYHWPRHNPAPHVPGLGVACKHVLAAWIYEQIVPMHTCPDCQGMGCTQKAIPFPTRDYPFQVVACQTCQTRGVILDAPERESTNALEGNL